MIPSLSMSANISMCSCPSSYAFMSAGQSFFKRETTSLVVKSRCFLSTPPYLGMAQLWAPAAGR